MTGGFVGAVSRCALPRKFSSGCFEGRILRPWATHSIVRGVSMIPAILCSRQSARMARPDCWRVVALVVVIGILSAPRADAQTQQLRCPTGSINLQSNIHVLNEACEFDGNI